MSPQSASDRLARLLALVPYLLARPGASVTDVAAAFGIEEERLVDDLELLFVCGLPGHMPDDLIEASIDDNGGILVGNADQIARPLRLGADEALALLVGLKALGTVTDLLPEGLGTDALASATAKLEQAAGDAAAAAEGVTVAVTEDAGARSLVREALERGRRLHLRYWTAGRDAVTERDVDPMRVLTVDGRTYLEGYCRRVEDVRMFRLDRVVEARLLDVAAEVPEGVSPRDLSGGLFQPGESDVSVVLELEPEGRWVAEYYPCEEVADLDGGRQRVRLRTPQTGWVVRLALRLAGAGRVVEPEHLVAEVAAAAEEALSAYA